MTWFLNSRFGLRSKKSHKYIHTYVKLAKNGKPQKFDNSLLLPNLVRGGAVIAWPIDGDIFLTRSTVLPINEINNKDWIRPTIRSHLSDFV